MNLSCAHATSIYIHRRNRLQDDRTQHVSMAYEVAYKNYDIKNWFCRTSGKWTGYPANETGFPKNADNIRCNLTNYKPEMIIRKKLLRIRIRQKKYNKNAIICWQKIFSFQDRNIFIIDIFCLIIIFPCIETIKASNKKLYHEIFLYSILF